jgi:hypothetical protein
VALFLTMAVTPFVRILRRRLLSAKFPAEPMVPWQRLFEILPLTYLLAMPEPEIALPGVKSMANAACELQ